MRLEIGKNTANTPTPLSPSSHLRHFHPAKLSGRGLVDRNTIATAAMAVYTFIATNTMTSFTLIYLNPLEGNVRFSSCTFKVKIWTNHIHVLARISHLIFFEPTLPLLLPPRLRRLINLLPLPTQTDHCINGAFYVPNSIPCLSDSLFEDCRTDGNGQSILSSTCHHIFACCVFRRN
ncbi:hypothetical protein BLNAU_22827 [Blattamonas nauphoetae]|uniref:Uncharacterized protein n=1 Tax=Blattamonas nauphoetae TaxID=2049346 RepID=A0ABQ9WSF1_9EUKA|nr:hypothetical protein BLNAU_22827 [Blattamonas nauphoetae]